ncbi:succinate dehydrogenase assembly factor 2 [Coelomomyces lativittatus]|nr:succinate dehydrogenase assembly factor 2 [Coelomomyces lativittatus]
MSTLPKNLSTLTHLQKKLIYGSRKRGILETTLVLSTYAHHRVPSFTPAQCMEYEGFLKLMDWDVWDMFLGRQVTPNVYQWIVSDLKETFRVYHSDQIKQGMRGVK